MCGIAGIASARPDQRSLDRVRAMTRAQSHRGPDGEGICTTQVGQLAVTLGHVRLAILDLSEIGRQPMTLPDGTGVLIFNGEIYNYWELRQELEREGVAFRTGTDTEVLMWGLRKWGKAALSRLNGMWALAWLDLQTQQMWLSRDRFGIKPLYYLESNKELVFASEIKAILAAVSMRFQVNIRAVGRFVDQSLLDTEDESFFHGIKMLPPGSCLEVDAGGDGRLRTHLLRYWSAPQDDSFCGTLAERIQRVREIFFDAVRIRLRSDVTLGVLLSGGVDSSAIAAMMRSILGTGADLHLLSATSHNPQYDERPYVELMARHLNSPVGFINLTCSPKEWFRLLEEVIYANDEPVGNFSTAAHYLLMQKARDLGITVVLSGQGADELLCGYRKFIGFRLQELLRERRPLKAMSFLAKFVANRVVLTQFEMSEAKRYLWLLNSPRLDIRGPQLRDANYRVDNGLGTDTLIDRQRQDLESLSVPALVHYEDRCSMAFGREIRLPFLDYRLVSMLLPMDPELKLHDGWTKWIFRKAMEPFLPTAIAWRKDKQGFVNPQGHWLRNELRPTIDQMLDGSLHMVDAGLVDRAALKRRFEIYCHQSPSRGLVSFKDVLNPIALELWMRRFEQHLAA
ncbi:MAG: asparagine synthase (glutamine-hydrolyzing) [Deltaproteobacteria bacterium]|nr:asparagine synthase (glutamine-hydrolyzing) [Deltaproteobacteria bacterium]